MNDKTIVYSTFYDPMQANIIRARLEDSGFACFLADENVATINPLYNQAIGGVKLIVFERDVEAIQSLLSEDIAIDTDLDGDTDFAAADSGALCPNCNSKNVSYGMATKNKYGIFASIIAFLTLSPPIVAKKCFHCYDCGHEFKVA
ncbi:putative signal transducing protein [Pedobacter sandarakinus]|uniref:putative signal transducing protein n=1 Tax=Pedobacter sandarakinus TaxID=353156 RepID=UPI0022462025|nr:DUF2007 domain-containing protein [Pedobacter sandarakinus]MCX2573097.1 DUF2007 domain-containing protein [Pedobacter sandarakinus]